MTTEYIGTATYSPEDNKIRISPFSRLSKEDYQTVRSAGFIWAPKQELFVAPMWTPSREDLAIQLCGEIGDEDKSLAERAEERAARFENYSERRANDAEQAHKAVSAIADNIPLGQPILVGHHSERHARKDAERIENGMRKAVKMWETSKYWEDRAASAIRHAKYKELPDVRARRIKSIEADKRKSERIMQDYKAGLRFWSGEMNMVNSKTGEKRPITITQENLEEIVKVLGNSNFASVRLPKKEGDTHDTPEAWTCLSNHYPSLYVPRTVAEVQEHALKVFRNSIAHRERWIAHYDNRLAYERAMLAAGGGLVATQQTLCIGGQVLRHGHWFVILKVNMRNGALSSVTVSGHFQTTISADEIEEYKPPQNGDFEKVKAITASVPVCNYPNEGFATCTQAEWDEIPNDYKITRGGRLNRGKIAGNDKFGAHFVRQALGCYLKLPPPTPEELSNSCAETNRSHSYWPVFVTDAKRKDPPAPTGQPAPKLPEREHVAPGTIYKAPEPTKFDALKETLAVGIKAVSAPQLFPTPPEIAKQVCELADLKPGICVLEPSAGTGNLVQAVRDLVDTEIVGVEINGQLCSHLRQRFPSYVLNVRQADFLTLNGDLGKYERIIMNPPFEKGSDIKHIKHALEYLAPGGRLVAICANGPRQQDQLRPLAENSGGEWIELPAGSFAEQGTNVNTAMLVINAPEPITVS